MYSWQPGEKEDALDNQETNEHANSELSNVLRINGGISLGEYTLFKM